MRRRKPPGFSKRISPDDRAEIEALIENEPSLRYHNVILAYPESDDMVYVLTGKYYGPRAGHGDEVVLKRSDAGWRVVSVTSVIM